MKKVFSLMKEEIEVFKFGVNIKIRIGGENVVEIFNCLLKVLFFFL